MDKTTQAVDFEISDSAGMVLLRLITAGVSPLEFTIDPQAAFEIGEKLARAAHQAKFGQPLQSDVSYLQSQIKARVTEQYRLFLIQRLSNVLNSTRENRTVSNGRLAAELVDLVLTKVA